MKVLVVCGEHQYGDPSRGVGTEYAAFVPALTRLGHEVVHFESWNRSCYRDLADLNQRLLHFVQAERPDAMLVVPMTYEIWLETLVIVRSCTATATVCWTTDDSWKYDQVSRFLAPVFDAITTTYPYVIPKYHRDGVRHVVETQWAASSSSLREPLPAARCRLPVSFVGAAHGNRMRRVERLRRKGIDVACFGYGWPAGAVAGEDIPAIMRESVISLNFANSYGENQIKARTFEVPGAGGFLLTEQAQHLDRWFRPGEEIETFRNDDELADKIRYYLQHHEARNRIAIAGYERTRSEHTYEKRLQACLEFACRRRDESTNPSTERRGDELTSIARQHVMTRPLRLLRNSLVMLCSAVWGARRGPRAARRIMFELSWRFVGNGTFRAAGWVGRMFPEQ